MMEFTPTEQEILRLVQGDMPDSATPFADIAAMVDVPESVVLELLQRLKDEGVIRRFGATLKHQKAGFGANAMVAWRISPDEELHRVGEIAATHPNISHCYHRRTTDEWPYGLYTMIHGTSKEECLNVVKELSQRTGHTDYQILESLEELKKISMTYFPHPSWGPKE